MKTSKEMADAVLKKRDAIEAQRIKRNIIIRRSVILSAVACVTGFIVLNSGKFSPEKPDIHNAVLVYNEKGEKTEEGKAVFHVGLGQPDPLTEKLTGKKSVRVDA